MKIFGVSKVVCFSFYKVLSFNSQTVIIAL